VTVKNLNAIPAWWGFTTASHKHRTEVFLHHRVPQRFCESDDPTIKQLANDMDETLFAADLLHNE